MTMPIGSDSPYNFILEQLKSNKNESNKIGMARFGINTEHAFGLSIPFLEKLAKSHKRDQNLAIKLWESGYNEARIMAAMIADPKQTDFELMDSWVEDFNSWDVCDQACGRLFAHTPFAQEKALAWALRDEEFVRRAGYALMACLALKKHKHPDTWYYPFLEHILVHSGDSRNFVWKAEHWALRQIGKRSSGLMQAAIRIAEALATSEESVRRKVGKTALKELFQKRDAKV
jgi:3-methyladenine DNA glycosylase AlkD